jgi:hypothetical protein
VPRTGEKQKDGLEKGMMKARLSISDAGIWVDLLSRCPGVFFPIQTRVAASESPTLKTKRQIYRLRKPSLRNVATAWKKM